MSKYKTQMQKAAAEKRLSKIEADFKPLTPYNGEIFVLFLRFCRRRRVTYEICHQAAKLKHHLETIALPAITRWSDAVIFDRENILGLTASQLRQGGKPFRKVALMLVEMGVFDKPLENPNVACSKLLATIGEPLKGTIQDYLMCRARQKRSPTTLYMILIDLKRAIDWLMKTNKNHLFDATKSDLVQLLDHCQRVYKNSTANNIFYRLNHFYEWGIDRGLISINPMPACSLAKREPKHIICSDTETQQLLAFARSEQSDPDDAMLVALMLLFAFSIEHCRTAKLRWTKELVEIYWPQQSYSFKARAERSWPLKCVPDSSWFHELLCRYLKNRQSRLLCMKGQAAHQPLFIQKSAAHPFGVGRSWIANRIASATLAATGQKIQPHILRQTSAVMHMRGNDTSLLRELGWAGTSALTYLWAPKIYHAALPDETRGDQKSEK